MPYRRCLLWLVCGLAVWLVSFAVLMGFQALFAALGDTAAARILGGVALAALVLLGVDVLLLVGVLGVLALHDGDANRHDPNGPPDESL